MSKRLALLNQWMRWREKPRLARVSDPVPLRATLEKAARMTTWAPRGTMVHRERLITASGDISLTRINPTSNPSKPRILYIHGGAFVMGSPEVYTAMAGRISRQTGLEICLPRYRLAPEHPFPASLKDVVAVYETLSVKPGGIILGGDSAGGGLCLAALGEILRLGLPRPRACFAFSPVTDLTFSGDSISGNADADVLLPASQSQKVLDFYLQGADAKTPQASPLYAEFGGACPVWLTVGSTEILLSDSERIADRMRARDVDVTLSIKSNCPHVWPFFHNFLPEGRETIRELADWLRSLSN